MILRASVLPKFLFGIGSWAPLTDAENRQFSGVLWRLFRPLLGLKYQQNQEVSFYACLALVGLPSPDTTLKMHRLLYLSQVVRHGPDALWTLMRADRPHSECLLDACRWLFLWVGPAGVGKLSGSGTGVPACCYCGPGWASSRSPGGVLLQLRLLVFRIVWRRVCRVGVPLPAECLGRGMQPVVMATGLRHFSSARAAFVPDVAKFSPLLAGFGVW